MVAIGLVLFLLLVPTHLYRERLFRRQHGADAPLSRELRYARVIYAGMAIVLLASVIASLS